MNTKELQRNFDVRWQSTRNTDKGFLNSEETVFVAIELLLRLQREVITDVSKDHSAVIGSSIYLFSTGRGIIPQKT